MSIAVACFDDVWIKKVALAIQALHIIMLWIRVIKSTIVFEPSAFLRVLRFCCWPFHYTYTDAQATTVLCEDDHTKICLITKSASSKWRDIGGELGFTFDELESIVREPSRHGDVDYYQAMLRRLSNWARAPPIASALRTVGKERLANILTLYNK